jgi:hypothetical protein
MDNLRRAIAQGYSRAYVAQDPDLDALHPRPDFQELMLDLSFPADPFAH